jgi:hypothetical protein
MPEKVPRGDARLLEWLKGAGGAAAVLALAAALFYSVGLIGLLLRAGSQHLPLSPVIYGQLPRESVLSIGAFVMFPSLLVTLVLVTLYRKAKLRFKAELSKNEGLEWFRRWIVIAFLASVIGMLSLVNSVFSYDKALVCVDGNQYDRPGLLVGQTDKWVYLGENAPGQARRIVSIPVEHVEAIYAGPDADGVECDKPPAHTSTRAQPSS